MHFTAFLIAAKSILLHNHNAFVSCTIEIDDKLIEDAMARGFIESALPLLILVGIAGSGKSLFKRLVLGQPVPEFSPSTPLAESAVRSMSMCQMAIGDKKWIIVGPQRMLAMVAEAIKEGVPVLESIWEKSSQLAFTSSQGDEADPEKHETQPVHNSEVSSGMCFMQ